jgi:hypothetical protein
MRAEANAQTQVMIPVPILTKASNIRWMICRLKAKINGLANRNGSESTPSHQYKSATTPYGEIPNGLQEYLEPIRCAAII